MKNRNRILLLLLLIGIVLMLYRSPARDMISFDNLKLHRETLLLHVERQYQSAAVIFIGTYIVITALSIPGATILTLAGGYLFGVLPAVLFVNIGATLGAILAFLAARYILGEKIQEKYEFQLASFNRELNAHASFYLLTLRLAPLFPFFVVNLLAGLTRVPVSVFAWTTSVGIIPGTAVYAFAGKQLGSISAPSDILSPRILAALTALALFAALPVAIKKYRTRDPLSGGRDNS